MKCLQCVKEGKKSKVYIGGSSTTLLGVSRYYDEDGNYHVYDPNIITTNYLCSNGHFWSEQQDPNRR